MRCDKCSSLAIRVIGDEKICVICGWADATYEPPKYKYRTQGVQYLATYNGEFDINNDTEVAVRIKNSPTNHKESLVFEVTCPWCNKQMDEASRTFHYKCDNKHRISIENNEDGTIEWQ